MIKVKHLSDHCMIEKLIGDDVQHGELILTPEELEDMLRQLGVRARPKKRRATGPDYEEIRTTGYSQEEIQKLIRHNVYQARAHVKNFDKLSKDCKHSDGDSREDKECKKLGDWCDIRTCPLQD